jgi:hypothetical protein
LLPEVTRDKLPDLIGRLRKAVAEQVGVTPKIGMASLPEDAITFESLVEKAVGQMDARVQPHPQPSSQPGDYEHRNSDSNHEQEETSIKAIADKVELRGPLSWVLSLLLIGLQQSFLSPGRCAAITAGYGRAQMTRFSSAICLRRYLGRENIPGCDSPS